jgi:putative intracellular protease/amidase
MQIAVFAYDHMTALDAVGPAEILSRLPGADTVLVGEARGPVRGDTGPVTLVVDAALDEVTTPDVVLVPGWSGAEQEHLLRPGPVRDWLRGVDEHTTWTASIGTGAIVLAAAGLLTGRNAATHWLAADWLAELGAHPVDQPLVADGKYLTAAGVSAGIDLGLRLATELDERTGRGMPLLLGYDPHAPAAMMASMRALRHFILSGSSSPVHPHRPPRSSVRDAI